MKGLWFALAVCLLVGFTVGAYGQDNKEKLLGKWELTKGEAPPGSTIEFTKDGKLKMVAKVKDKEFSMEGTYKVDGDKIVTALKIGEKEIKETMTIKTLTDKALVTLDEKGKTDEFKKVK